MKKGPAVLLVLGLFVGIIWLSWQPSPKRSGVPSPNRLNIAVTGEMDSDQEAYARLYTSVQQYMHHAFATGGFSGEWGLTHSPGIDGVTFRIPHEANFLLWASLDFESKADTLRFCRTLAALPGIEIGVEETSPFSSEGQIIATLPIGGQPPNPIMLKNGLFALRITSPWQG